MMVKAALQKAHEAPFSTKARILAAAETIFAAKGFEGASTREIAEKAGVNISSLHYHWESKERLYFAVFQDIYDQILEVVRTSIAPLLRHEKGGRGVIETMMGKIFDLFADNANISKLLIRRILENEDTEVAIERDILMPAWKVFASWMKEFGGKRLHDMDSQLFILSLQAALLFFALDSQQYARVLGGSLKDSEIRKRVRDHVIHHVLRLVGIE